MCENPISGVCSTVSLTNEAQAFFATLIPASRVASESVPSQVHFTSVSLAQLIMACIRGNRCRMQNQTSPLMSSFYIKRQAARSNSQTK